MNQASSGQRRWHDGSRRKERHSATHNVPHGKQPLIQTQRRSSKMVRVFEVNCLNSCFARLPAVVFRLKQNVSYCRNRDASRSCASGALTGLRGRCLSLRRRALHPAECTVPSLSTQDVNVSWRLYCHSRMCCRASCRRFCSKAAYHPAEAEVPEKIASTATHPCTLRPSFPSDISSESVRLNSPGRAVPGVSFPLFRG
jgi:hypothetical protein